MEDILLQNYDLQFFNTEDDQEANRLSFCHMQENNPGPIKHSPIASWTRPDELFEFSTSQTRPVSSIHNDIVFCGKIINNEEEQLNEYEKRDYFATIKSRSLRKPSFSDRNAADDKRRSSSSTRFSGDLTRSTGGDLDYHVQRVNISSLTSMSAKSRRWMFMFGPVKFKPEMELSAIKQRQARREPAEKTVASGGAGVVRSGLMRRSYLSSVLARSFGCIPAAALRGGVVVAN
ncbi:hypothetical protein BUALT_Bualt06G0021900 [Buddleja alternifolia]|uniref:Uncharacterized protein n=1 Tax=Buddleja alternifolia TaxID=168488 RepID=A0AAV6XMX8_9LAMI|nr:hypothetical protein BUALT_Bualt06G0021900 [Buddleja alternifolia]